VESYVERCDGERTLTPRRKPPDRPVALCNILLKKGRGFCLSLRDVVGFRRLLRHDVLVVVLAGQTGSVCVVCRRRLQQVIIAVRPPLPPLTAAAAAAAAAA